MRLVLILCAALAGSAFGQETLPQQIRGIAADARGTVCVSCSLPGSPLNCDLNATAHAPMQSVFKLPVAIAMLHQVEQGKCTLDQPIPIRPADLFVPHAYSPLQDKFPGANVDVPLRELLQRSVSESDNVAADILLRLTGGPKVVSDYMASIGVHGFHFMDGEHAMHRDELLQYRNWFEPVGAVQLLRALNDHSPLTRDDSELLFSWMRNANIKARLQGDLPTGTIVAHKTGSSGMEKGLAAATNDIGLITLPDGRQLAIAVFITDAKADDAMRDKVIARIGRAVYDAALRNSVSR